MRPRPRVGGPDRCAMPRIVSSIVALVLAALAIGTMSAPALGATPGSGTIRATSPTTAWTGQSYVVGTVAVPEECPPPAEDPGNLVCDHFLLKIDLDPNFWALNTGQV